MNGVVMLPWNSAMGINEMGRGGVDEFGGSGGRMNDGRWTAS